MELALVETHAPLVWWTPFVVIAAGFIGPVADIDEPESWVARRVPILGQIIGRVIRHRTVTHSILFVALFWLFVCKIVYVPLPFHLPWGTFALALVIGYASHPFIDLFNPQGVQLFWPLPFWIKLLPDFLAVPVESPMEDIVRLILKILFAVVGFSFVVIHLHMPRELGAVSQFAWHIERLITFS
jgi:inner membrane protein